MSSLPKINHFQSKPRGDHPGFNAITEVQHQWESHDGTEDASQQRGKAGTLGGNGAKPSAIAAKPVMMDPGNSETTGFFPAKIGKTAINCVKSIT